MRRYIVLLIAFGTALTSDAQGTLSSASIQVKLAKEEINITQTFHLDLPDTITQVHLKALRFAHLSISDFTTQSPHSQTIESDSRQSQLHSYTVNVADDQSIEDLSISYTWHRAAEKAEIPLFFPDMPAASSSDSFFLGQIQMPEVLAFRMDFPKVDFNQFAEDSRKMVNFSLPALPSLLRIHYGDETDLSLDIGLLADWSIAAVFVIMAILIWFNRKRLAYG